MQNKNNRIDYESAPAITALSWLYYFLDTTRKFKSDALKIKSINDYENSATPTFETLTSLCLEMLPKVLIGCQICLKYENNKKISSEDIMSEIGKEMSKAGHDLQELYDNDLDLCKKLKINTFSTFKNRFTMHYEIVLSNSSKIYIKDFISIRYGAFAKNKTFSYGDKKNEDAIIKLLDNLEEHVKNELTKTARKLKKMDV